MENTYEKFVEAYRNASDHIKTIIDSEEIGLFVENLETPSAKLQRRELIVIISNTILGVFSQSEFNEKLNNALALEDEVIKKVFDFTNQKMSSLGGGASEIPSAVNSDTQTEPALQPVRTMSTDRAAAPIPQPEVIYSSVQSAILNESK